MREEDQIKFGLAPSSLEILPLEGMKKPPPKDGKGFVKALFIF
jgi:hypothetical protein